jgi:hypothetical protein
MGIRCKLFGHRWTWKRAQDSCEEVCECTHCHVQERRAIPGWQHYDSDIRCKTVADLTRPSLLVKALVLLMAILSIKLSAGSSMAASTGR